MNGDPEEVMSDYPEHDKLKEISDKSQAIGDFIEWLRAEKELVLCEVVPNMASGFAGLYYTAAHCSTTALLAEFFEIDQSKIEKEKRAMIEEMRKANAAT